MNSRVFGIHITNENSCLGKNPHICIGWGALGDLTKFKTKEEIELQYENVYPKKPKNAKAQNIGQICRFLFEANIGDYVIYRSNKLIHIGVITSDAYYKNDFEQQSSDYVNNRDVKWIVHYSTNILSRIASNSLGSAMSFFGMDAHMDEIKSLIDESYLSKISIFNELLNANEIDPKKYDGSFELIDEVSKAYQNMDINDLNYRDLELFYFSCIGTWKSSFQNKSDRIIASNLPDDKKRKLVSFLNELQRKTEQGYYEHSEIEGKHTMGLFGTGFGTLKRLDDDDVKRLLKLFINLSQINEEESCYDLIKKGLSKKIKGVKTGFLSPILFCLKPMFFPIINGNQGVGVQLFEKLGIVIEEPREIENYVYNSQNIREFRNKHFKWKNYRIFDLASFNLKDSEDGKELKQIKAYYNDEGIFTCDTGLTKLDWIDILKNNNLIDNECLNLIKFWYNKNNHEACCKEVGDILYPDDYNSVSKVNGKITGRCQMICNEYGLLIDNEGNNRYFPVMMDGRYSTYDGAKVYNWILKPEVVEAIEELELVNVEIETIDSYEAYTKADFLSDVFITEDNYNEILNVIKRKNNIILQGTPGVGKTYMAKRLAYSMMGEKNNERIEMIQFHQSYSYEDFIFGYQPTDTSFKLKPGIFYTFCKKAEKDLENSYFFIIDEINRGNLSKIFGELLMLIENDKRGQKLTLSHTQEPFTVPENIYIIGMMNTADRSLAIVDYALRRRFSIISVKPAFGNAKFKTQLITNGCNPDLADKIISKFINLNKDISNDTALGEGFEIGHSYFCNVKNLDESSYKEIIDVYCKMKIEK